MDAKKFIVDSLNESSETKLKIKDNLQEEILKAVDLISNMISYYLGSEKGLLDQNCSHCFHLNSIQFLQLYLPSPLLS